MALAKQPGTSKEGRVTLYDVGNPLQPMSLCTLTGVSRPQFVSANEISYVARNGDVSSIVIKTLGSSGTTRIVLTQPGIGGPFSPYVWTPDAKTLLFMVDSGDNHQLWIKQGDAAPRALTPPMPVAPRSPGPFDHVTVAISKSGNYLVMVDTLRQQTNPPSLNASQLQVMHLPDGTRVLAEGGSSGPGMPAWSRVFTKLWYRDTQGVKLWDPSSASSFNDLIGPNIFWFDPTTSPDGHNVAYAIFDAKGSPRINTMDEFGHVRALPVTDRSHPIYASANSLWYVEEKACRTPCGARIDPPSNAVFAYDLLRGIETRLPIGAVYDYWPR